MIRKLLIITSLLLLAGILRAEEISLSSPDNQINVTINIDKDIQWSVDFKDTPLIERAVIGLKLSSGTIGIEPKITKKTISVIDEVLLPVVPNKDASIRNNCNELVLSFKGKTQLVFRAYNDGVAYRFLYNSEKAVNVMDETMDVTFPDQSLSLFPLEESMYSHNERFYINKSLKDISAEDFCSLPVLFKTKENVNVLFTETALHNYPNMFLKGSSNNAVHTKFPKYVLEALPAPGNGSDRNQIISREADYIAKTTGSQKFPWRLFVIGENDKDLVESNLAYQLANPTGIEKTDWIKPGRVAWDWYNANNIFGVDFKSGINNETYKYYIDFASDNGIEYVILDEGWTKSTTEIMACNPDIDVEALVEYGKTKNVDIILWVLWKPLSDNMTEILETYHKWGAKGIKVDFMQRSDQGMVESYEAIAQECARLKMLVDYHGAFKPSGLRRVYPNVINYEGVKGSENNKWSNEITPEHNVTIPFIRMVAGPLDYTPGVMRNAHLANHRISHYRPMSLGTRAHQVAMYVVYEAPLQMLCENPSIYKQEQECVDFMVQIPTTWDETKVLEGKVGDYIVVARKKGNNWYIGAMTDWTARDFNLDLSFLGEGEFNVEILKDGINADTYAEDYKKLQTSVNRESKLVIAMASGGGWTAILKRK